MLTLLAITILLALVATAAAVGARTKPHHSVRYLTAVALNRGLAGTPMQGLGFELEAAGFRYHVSPALVAAIAGSESSFGVQACGVNYWGWNSCNGQPWSTVREGIRYVSLALRDHYLSRGLLTVYAVGYRYCGRPGVCNLDRWVAHTSWYMRRLGGDPSELRYGARSAVA